MMGNILGLLSLLIMPVTLVIAVILAIKKNPAGRIWFIGTGLGLIMFIVALVITPDITTTISPDVNLAPSRQEQEHATVNPNVNLAPSQQEQEHATVSPDANLSPPRQEQESTSSATYR